MDVERNKTNLTRVFEEGFTLGRLEVIDACLAPDARDRHAFEPDAPDFPSHLKAVITMVRGVLPDLRAHVDDVVAEDDRVAARVTMTGTKADGTTVRVEQFHIVHFDQQGRGVAHWAAVGGLPEQLGTPSFA
jgi:predicted ester cyclase